MKSSYELALERSGGSLNKLDDEKKAKIAALDIKYKAKMAEAELAVQERLKKSGGDFAKIEEIQNDMQVEIASIKSKWEREKDAIRNA